MNTIISHLRHPNSILKSLLWKFAKYIKDDKVYLQLKTANRFIVRWPINTK